VEVVDSTTGNTVVSPTTTSTFTIPLQADHSYLVEQTNALNSSLPFAQVTGQAATSYKALGSVTIGLPGSGVIPTPTPTSTPGSTPTPNPTSTSTPVTNGSCKVNYTVTNQWSDGFGANIAITNTGSTAWNNWTLKFTFPGSQQVTQLWNGSVTQSGASVTITNSSYNAQVPAGAAVSPSPGFNGSFTGSNPNPTSFTLNGVACTTS
jgi:cellulase/cellobiase CelA1